MASICGWWRPAGGRSEGKRFFYAQAQSILIAADGGQEIAVKAVAALVRDRTDIENDGAIDDAIEMTFALERDLQQALRKNIDQLEPSLT